MTGRAALVLVDGALSRATGPVAVTAAPAHASASRRSTAAPFSAACVRSAGIGGASCRRGSRLRRRERLRRRRRPTRGAVRRRRRLLVGYSTRQPPAFSRTSGRGSASDLSAARPCPCPTRDGRGRRDRQQDDRTAAVTASASPTRGNRPGGWTARTRCGAGSSKTLRMHHGCKKPSSCVGDRQPAARSAVTGFASRIRFSADRRSSCRLRGEGVKWVHAVASCARPRRAGAAVRGCSRRGSSRRGCR